MDPNLIALAIVVMVIYTAIITFCYRIKPLHTIFKGGRIWWALLAAVFSCAFMFAAAGVGRKCDIEGPKPESYIEGVFLGCVFLLLLLVEKRHIKITNSLFIIGIGVLLAGQFDLLVNNTNQYYAIDARTHKLMAKGCSYDPIPTNMVQIEMWHSWFTGIYKVKN